MRGLVLHLPALLWCFTSAPHAVGADDYYAWQEKLSTLDQRCEEARARHLAPIRRELEKQCEQEAKQSSASSRQCSAENSTYGNNATGIRGGRIPGRFYDLPECLAAAEGYRSRDTAQQWRR